jgi:hypothetical protein
MQGEMEEELDKSMRSFGIDPASGRLSTVQYKAAREELQRRQALTTRAGCVQIACMMRTIRRHDPVENQHVALVALLGLLLQVRSHNEVAEAILRT